MNKFNKIYHCLVFHQKPHCVYFSLPACFAILRTQFFLFRTAFGENEFTYATCSASKLRGLHTQCHHIPLAMVKYRILGDSKGGQDLVPTL